VELITNSIFPWRGRGRLGQLATPAKVAIWIAIVVTLGAFLVTIAVYLLRAFA
jgi:hypothetical protein